VTGRIFTIAVLLALAALPLVSGEYYVNLASQIIIFAVFASSINLLLGYGGLLTLSTPPTSASPPISRRCSA
jgi:branched-chain amino acid transport system permease protein